MSLTVAHLTTVDMSLRFLVLPQLLAVRDRGGRAIGISAPGPWVGDLEAAGIEHFPLRSSTRSMSVTADARAAHELWQILRRERVDVLHTHNPKPGLYGRVVGRIARVPVVVNTVHGLYATDDDSLAKRALVYGLEGIAARCSDAELYQNPEDLELMRRLHCTRHARFLGNGVDLQRFDPARFSAADRAAIRAELGVGDDTVLVGAVGRLVAEKGYPELFTAMEQLPASFALVVVGADDPEKPDSLPADLVARAEARGVRFLGPRDDVDRLYAAMDVFVLASHREGFPRAAMEASAMALPVVATDVRGCREVVAPGSSGFLVPVRDPAALATALIVFANVTQRARFGQSARSRAVEHFDERRIVDTVLETYRDVGRRKRVALSGL
jgi:glycosyltransferase involved in cell wall biosynthesis